MLKRYLSLVKFAHTVFALPFALVGVTLGFLDAEGFDPWVLVGVLLCMVFARNAAMGFNRWADRSWDALNARTAVREIPAGKLSARQALVFVGANAALFVLTTWFINPLVFILSPVALLVVLGYSYTKRFTALCHLVLGLGLALAPVGAYLAVTAQFAWPPVVLGVVVLCWVAGFDIIYALQDEEFDLEYRLQSIPAALGAARALLLSRILHLLAAGLLVLFALLVQAGWLLGVAVALFILLLLRQHSLVGVGRLDKVNLAFFTTNGLASVIFGVLAILDLVLLGQG